MWTRRSGSHPRYRTKAHKQARATLLKTYTPGDPCCLCGHPMYPPTSGIHADHVPGTDTYRGLAHGTTPCQVCGKRCNISDGAKRGSVASKMTKIIKTNWTRPNTASRW